MKIISYAILAAAILLTSLSANAFTSIRSGIRNEQIFGIKFPDNTLYYARHGNIISISKQRYFANGYIVTEIVIDMLGANSLLRIYNMSLPEAEDAKKEIKNALPDNLKPFVDTAAEAPKSAITKLEEKLKPNLAKGQDIVVKTYPQTTHAKTLEYSIANLEELEEFFLAISRDFTKSTTDESIVSETAEKTAKAAKGDTSKSKSDSYSMDRMMYIFDEDK